jgi:hypothetical protein
LTTLKYHSALAEIRPSRSPRHENGNHGGACMTRREREDAQMWVTWLVVSLIAAAGLAWIAPVVDLLAANPKTGEVAGTTGAEPSCGNCGVIEGVRERPPAASRHEALADGRAGVVMMILGALGGDFRLYPTRIYEVEVRMEDGSVRTFQSATPSERKPGDRVKVVRGRIEQIS